MRKFIEISKSSLGIREVAPNVKIVHAWGTGIQSDNELEPIRFQRKTLSLTYVVLFTSRIKLKWDCLVNIITIQNFLEILLFLEGICRYLTQLCIHSPPGQLQLVPLRSKCHLCKWLEFQCKLDWKFDSNYLCIWSDRSCYRLRRSSASFIEWSSAYRYFFEHFKSNSCFVSIFGGNLVCN